MLSPKIVFNSCLFFIIGIFFSSFVSIPFYILLLIFIFILIIGSFFLKRVCFFQNKWLIFFVLIFFCFGFFYYQKSFDNINEKHISFYQEQNINFQGEVIKYPEKETEKLKIVLGKIKKQEEQLKGKVLINTLLYSDYQYGDILDVECKLMKPGSFKGFDYDAYLAKEDIYSVCYYPKIKILEKETQKDFLFLIFSLKDKIKSSIDSHFSEPQGSFLSAVLLGIKYQIPKEIRFWFAQSGIVHILAISGLHVAILCQILLIFFTNVLLISREKAFWPTALLVILFVLLAGIPSSAIRAAIMGLSLIWTQKIGRPQSGKRIVLYAATIMLLLNPKLLSADIGFQLSFLAVLGIGFFYSFFNNIFKKIPFKEFLSVSLSAQIFVLPLILYYFGNLSLIGVIINIIVLPLMPFIMILGFSFGLLGLFSIFLARIISYPLWFLITGIVLFAKIGAYIPYASFIIVDFPLWMVFYLYFFIFFWVLKINKNNEKKD